MVPAVAARCSSRRPQHALVLNSLRHLKRQQIPVFRHLNCSEPFCSLAKFESSYYISEESCARQMFYPAGKTEKVEYFSYFLQ